MSSPSKREELQRYRPKRLVSPRTPQVQGNMGHVDENLSEEEKEAEKDLDSSNPFDHEETEIGRAHV